MRRLLKTKQTYEIDIKPVLVSQPKQYLQYRSFHNNQNNHSIPNYKFHENENNITVVYPNNKKTELFFANEQDKLIKQQSEDIYREQLRKLDEKYQTRRKFNLKLTKEIFGRNQILYQQLRGNKLKEKQYPLKGCLKMQIVEESLKEYMEEKNE